MQPTPGDLDRDAARRVLGGDLNAFEGIVERWQRPLVNLAYRYCRNREQAEDMAQEAFLRAFRGLRQRREEAAFSTWLIAVAINVFRSHMRRAGSPEVPNEEHREAIEPSRGPADHAADRELQDVVRRAVSTLPPKYRDAMVLFYFLDQDVRQAAASLGLADGTLKSRLHRGRELLKARLSRILNRDGWQ